MSLPLLRALKWATVWTFILRGIGITKRQTFGFTNLLNKIGLLWNFWLWNLITFLPLEVKLHTVPHFKALNSGKDIHNQQGYGCTFICTRLLWKVPILLHTEQIGRVFIGVSVLDSMHPSSSRGCKSASFQSFRFEKNI